MATREHGSGSGDSPETGARRGARRRHDHEPSGNPPDASTPWIDNRAPSRWFSPLDLREFWRYRTLAFHLGLRDVKVRYKQTLFGVAWAIVQPLAAVGIFTVVFGNLVGVPSDGLPYVVFAYSGLVAWGFFSTAVGGGAGSLVEHRGMVTHVYFPRLLAPFAALFPAVVDLVFTLSILAVLLVVNGVNPGPALVLGPLWIVALAGTSVAFGVALSALNALYRDVRYVLPFLLQLLFFTSPVIFSSSLFTGDWRFLYSLNPLVGALDGFRWSFAGGPAPQAEDLLSLSTGLILLVCAVAYFQKVEGVLADRI